MKSEEVESKEIKKELKAIKKKSNNDCDVLVVKSQEDTHYCFIKFRTLKVLNGSKQLIFNKL